MRLRSPRSITRAITWLVAAGVVMATPVRSPAPTTKDQREILAETTETGVVVGSFLVDLDVDFLSDDSVQNFVRERTANRPRDRSRHLLVFQDASGARIAEISADLVVKAADRSRDLETQLVRVDSMLDPLPEPAPAKRASARDARFRRKWSSEIVDPSGRRAIIHRMTLKVRARGFGSHTVVQTVESTTPTEVVVRYDVLRGSTAVATGAVMVTATPSASGGYTEGPIIVDDDDD